MTDVGTTVTIRAGISGDAVLNHTQPFDLINDGTLRLRNTNANAFNATLNINGPVKLVNNGTLQLEQHTGAGQRTIGGAVQNNGTLVVTASDGVLTGGLLNQSGGTLSGGVLDVSGSLSYAGANIVTNDATLIVDGAGALIENLLGQDALRNLTTNTGMLTITNGATVSPIGGITNTATVLIGPGATLAPGGLYVQTAGLTTVDGGTLAATVDIQGGTFDGAGTVLGGLRNAGVVAPGGSADTLIVTGAYLQLAGSALELEIGGASPGTGHDLLQIGGTANLSGTLHIDTIGAFTPTPGQRFTVLRATGGRTGNWGTVTAIHGRWVRLHAGVAV